MWAINFITYVTEILRVGKSQNLIGRKYTKAVNEKSLVFIVMGTK